jgi:putative SOS response-associated peptidase YedK
MCGRDYRRSDKQRIADAFKLGKLPDDFVLPPDYNVAPATFQPVIRTAREAGTRELSDDAVGSHSSLPYIAEGISRHLHNMRIEADEFLAERAVICA